MISLKCLLRGHDDHIAREHGRLGHLGDVVAGEERSWHMTAKSSTPRRSVAKKGKVSAARRAARKSARSIEAAVSTHAPDTAERQFVEATIVRGEAVEAGQPVPPGATHEIVKRDEFGQPILKRRRFSTC